MAIILTEKAAAEIQRVRDEQKLESDQFLRVGVTGGGMGGGCSGCSGCGYTLGFDKTYDVQADNKYNLHGIDVVIDKESSLFLDGATIDWHDSLEKRGFTFENPNAAKSCGGGDSSQA